MNRIQPSELIFFIVDGLYLCKVLGGVFWDSGVRFVIGQCSYLVDEFRDI